MTPQKSSPRKGGQVRRAVVAGALALTLSAGGTTAWALDRFVFEHVEISDVAAYEASQGGAAAGVAAETGSPAETTDTSYASGDTNITISTAVTGSGDSTGTYDVADVVFDDATTLQSAFAENSFGENITETTSDIAADHNAVFAINGDYYGFRDTGIVIRNGVAYRDEGARQGLAFYRDGTVRVYDETATTAGQLVADGVWNTLSFGPAVLEDGEIVDGIEDVEVDTNFGNHSIQGEQPRTAVGIIDTNHVVFVVVDGRSPGYSAGVTMTGWRKSCRTWAPRRPTTWTAAGPPPCTSTGNWSTTRWVRARNAAPRTSFTWRGEQRT
jgi:hypothetical protein